MTRVQPTEKLIALFKRLDAKGLKDDAVDWDIEMRELEDEMKLGVCARCCFASCRCRE